MTVSPYLLEYHFEPLIGKSLSNEIGCKQIGCSVVVHFQNSVPIAAALQVSQYILT